MRFLVPQGIGDSVWSLHKAQDIAKKLGDGIVDIFVACSNVNQIETRALEFIQRFPFVRKAHMYPIPTQH